MLKNYLLPILIAGMCCAAGCDSAARHDALTLWYDAPAESWVQTLPLGNGRLGAMPDGGIAQERITLNEITLWSGSEHDTDNPDAATYLPEIRSLLLEGRSLEAQELMYSRFVCRGGGSAAAPYGSYQTLGDLVLDFAVDTTAVSGYERGLSLADATAWTRFTASGVDYEREYFVSRTGDVVAIRLRASKKGTLNFSLALSRSENASVGGEGEALVMRGVLPSGQDNVPGMAFVSKTVVQSDGEVSYGEQSIEVRNAREAVVWVSSATSYRGVDPETVSSSLLADAGRSDFDELKAAHTKDYKRYFDRVSLDLGTPAEDVPTDVRLRNFSVQDDPAFAALYMQFGRYLMISSTREGSLPPNLQGLWANTTDTPWKGDYHLNINVEMNHWITGVGNLSELQRPLIEYTKGLVPSGERTARVFYGTKGWCAHVLANAWNFSAPSENPSWGATNTGGAWLALHLWEQYRFNPDTTYLREVYPVLRGAAEFFLENLIEEPEDGWLVTAPTSSPENGFYDESREKVTYVCMGSAMDTQIVRELFGAVVESSAVLGEDAAFAERIEQTAERLPPYLVGEEGRLMEWLKDYEEEDPQHRHVSHLFGLYPGTQLTFRRTPGLMDACRATLDRRGDEGTGWSRAWKICFWARLGDGNRAYKLLRSLLQEAVVPDAEGERGGTYPNLFCAHPPFQIDGNFGGAAGIGEMLLQSHDGCIEVLPACPDAWAKGEFRGLRARGGVTVDCRWEKGAVREVTLTADRDATVRLCVPGSDGVKEVSCRAGKPERLKF